MTSKHAKRAKKKRTMLVEAAIPADVREEISPELVVIVDEYFRELLGLPVEKYGTEWLDKRLEFAKRKAKDFLRQGPAVLGDKTVAEILAVGFADEIVEATFTKDFYKELEIVVGAALATGIYKFLQAVETAVANLPNEALASFSLDECGAETFRTLSDEFSGTFDELVEVARTL